MRRHVMTSDEYLAAAKERALRYLDAHDPRQAFTSMLTDMRRNPHFENHPGNTIGVGFMLLDGWIDNPAEVRR
jgi:hypothetical protein